MMDDPIDQYRGVVAYSVLVDEIDRLRQELSYAIEQRECECSPEDACRFARERDVAKAENDRLRAILEEWTDWRPGVGMIAYQKPGHGSCCTCQTCGQFHDDCVCEHNEIEEAMQAAEATKENEE